MRKMTARSMMTAAEMAVVRITKTVRICAKLRKWWRKNKT